MITRYQILAASCVLLLGCSSIGALSRKAGSSSTKGAVERLTSESPEETSGDEGVEEQPSAGEVSPEGSASGQEPDPEVLAADLSEHLASGVIAALQSPAAQRHLTTITANATRAAVQSALEALADPELHGSLHQLTHATSEGLADDLQTTLAPALADSMRAEFVPALSQAIASESAQTHLGAATRNAAHQAVIGAGLGLQDTLGAAENAGTRWLWLLVALVGLSSLALVAAAVIAVARARHAQAEVSRLESATLLLATAVRDRHQTSEADEIASIVQQSLESSARTRSKHGLLGALGMRR